MIITVYDIETTGYAKQPISRKNEDGSTYIKDTDDITEVGYVRLDSCRNMAPVSAGSFTFYRPEYEVENTAHITGLKRDYLKKRNEEIATFEDSLARLTTLIFNSYLVGKNNKAFDDVFVANFLRKYYSRLGKPPVYATILGSVDIQEQVKPIWRREQTSKGIQLSPQKAGTLEDYANMYGITKELVMTYLSGVRLLEGTDMKRCSEFHSALYDASITAIIYTFLYKNGHFK